jgi:hypothetical protein
VVELSKELKMIYVTINFNYNSCLFHYRLRYTRKISIECFDTFDRRAREKDREREEKKSEGEKRNTTDKTSEFIYMLPQESDGGTINHHYIIRERR